MPNTKFILVNIRGNITPLTKEEYDAFKNNLDWMDDVFGHR